MPEQEPLDGDPTTIDCSGIEDDQLRYELHSQEIDPDTICSFIVKGNMDLFIEVAREFKYAESAMKMAELQYEVDIPSINELRYVAYHIFRCCQFYNAPHDQHEELKRALRHCQRASYDAIELGIINELEFIKVFKEQFQDVTISETLPNYIDLLKEARRIQSFLAEPGSIEERGEYYKQAKQELERLQEINSNLIVTKEELNKRQLHNKRSERRDKIMTFATFGSLLVAAMALIYSYTSDNNHNNKDITAEATEQGVTVTKPSN
ncbi:MAG: hypothetical protein AB2770_06580 [Candidatus Thiodiazotropha taylori]